MKELPTISLLIAAGKLKQARAMIAQALECNGGNASAAARELGTSYTQVKRWMEACGVERKVCPTCKQAIRNP